MGTVQSVLVVDDEAVVRDVVVRYLDREGFLARQAPDGAGAREAIRQDAPSLVILDLMLPDVNGFDLCRWIRESSDMPVILLTARGEEQDRITGLELGADDYLVKPFSPRELMVRVKTILRRCRPTSPPGRLTAQSRRIDHRLPNARGDPWGPTSRLDGEGVPAAVVSGQLPTSGLLA